jgi:hypothetical protein
MGIYKSRRSSIIIERTVTWSAERQDGTHKSPHDWQVERAIKAAS